MKKLKQSFSKLGTSKHKGTTQVYEQPPTLPVGEKYPETIVQTMPPVVDRSANVGREGFRDYPGPINQPYVSSGTVPSTYTTTSSASAVNAPLPVSNIPTATTTSSYPSFQYPLERRYSVPLTPAPSAASITPSPITTPTATPVSTPTIAAPVMMSQPSFTQTRSETVIENVAPTREWAPGGTVTNVKEAVSETGERVIIETREIAPVVQERLVPTQVKEIQPIIYREVEVVEVRRIIQPIYEKIEQPVKIEQMVLPSEDRGIITTREHTPTETIHLPVVTERIVKEPKYEYAYQESKPSMEERVIEKTVTERVEVISQPTEAQQLPVREFTLSNDVAQQEALAKASQTKQFVSSPSTGAERVMVRRDLSHFASEPQTYQQQFYE